MADIPVSKTLTGDEPLDKRPSLPGSVNTLPQLFQRQAASQPRATAFSCRTGDELKQLSYAEADAIVSSVSNQLAGPRSSPRDDGPAPVIAVWLEKGLDLVLSILATTYSGATWLPFDPDVPVERAAVCIADTGATTLITDEAHAFRISELQQQTDAPLRAAGRATLQCYLFKDLVAKGSNARPTPPPGPRPQDAAYIIMTSGTTGTPKGIAIPHSAALTFALSEQLVLQTNSSDVVWNGFSPAFDMFVEEMWVTVAGGGHLAVGTRQECLDVPGLPTVWRERGVTIVNAVPTHISIMDLAHSESGDSLLPSCIRLINLGGEACPPSLADRLARPGLRILNTYGPTETTVTATWDELQPGAPVTIGKPLPGYHACLLPILEDSPQTSLVPLDLAEDAEGELAIGGPCVGLGYIGRPELTEQKFMRHPLASNSNERLYRTGDRVKLARDGKIVFIGRIDTQIKHRGFRIELGEIESKLYGIAEVQAAAVILANPGSDDARLEAFVVVKQGTTLDVDSLQRQAFLQLPTYMRPEEVFYLSADEMPRLPSGKINAKGLHETSKQKNAERPSQKCDYDDTSSTSTSAVPETALTIFLGALESIFPQAKNIKPDTDVFDHLGGHSLQVAMLVSRLRKTETKADGSKPYASIGLADIYEGRTPANIAPRFTFSEKYRSMSSDSKGDSDFEKNPESGSMDHLPVSRLRYVLCGMAQIIPLLFLFFTHAVEILTPYLVFDFFALRGQMGWAILVTYGVFVAIPPCLVFLAIGAKWLLLGKVQPGEHPLYGTYYFRWWLADRLTAHVNEKFIAESPLYSCYLRAMGAKVGKCCHLGALSIGVCGDLVEIGDDVVMGTEVLMGVSFVERGRLIFRKVDIGNDAIIGAKCMLEGGASMGEAAELAPLSCVSEGMHVPAYQRFHGSPARFERDINGNEAGLGRRSRPSTARTLAMSVGNAAITLLVLPLSYYLPQIPGLLLFDALHLRNIGEWGQVAVMVLPAAFIYLLLVFAQLLIVRRLFLGRLREGKYRLYSFWYLRKWYVDRMMDMALTVLHPVFATLYIVPFLRLLGVKIGKRAEVSTARRLSFELLEIGEESFVADGVVLGSVNIRGNEIILKKTTMEARAFAGNASVLPSGSTLASETLLGVLSIAPPPDRPMASGNSCFGSPPVLLPSRQRAEGHDDSLLYRPTKPRVAGRLLVEGLRIVMPRALIIFGLAFSMELAAAGYGRIGAVHTLLMLPLFYLLLLALPALTLTALLKWLVIGRYHPCEWPLWKHNVWISEAVTSTYQTVVVPLIADLLVGTPYLAWCYRLFGVKIGHRCTILATDVTEYDCIEIGDETAINTGCGIQTHLFEDRVMKIGKVKIGKQACLKPYSIALPGSTIGDQAELGSLSLLMKNEGLPDGTSWEGAPVVPRKRREKKMTRDVVWDKQAR